MDLSRFSSGNSYVLSRDVENPKVDRRRSNGGPEISAHRLFPCGLRLICSVYQRGRRTEYDWEADGGHQWRYFRVQAWVRDGEVSVLPHPDHDAVHHRVACAILDALVPEATTLASLQARARAQHESGWDVLAHLIERGLLSIANVESSVDHLLRARAEEREAVIQERQAAREAATRAKESTP